MASAHSHVGDLLASGRKSFSFEFFPPKTDQGESELWTTLQRLEELQPTFVSVTYGAGGSTRDRTIDITAHITDKANVPAVAHLTCVGSSVQEITDIVRQYQEAGISNILALRGDPQAGPGAQWVQHEDGLAHADELVSLIKSLGDFSVGVAAFPEGHPESSSLDDDARVLARKQEVGAEYAITQLFFDVQDYINLVQRARAVGCSMPIIPGIMPVTNVSQIERFATLSGATFPEELAQRFHRVADDPAAVRELGVDVATQMCAELLECGAPGLHFYTLNRSTATIEIYRNLDLSRQ